MKTIISAITLALFCLASVNTFATENPAGSNESAQHEKKKPKKPKKPKKEEEGWNKCPSPPYKAGCAVKPPMSCSEGCPAPTSSLPASTQPVN